MFEKEGKKAKNKTHSDKENQTKQTKRIKN